VTWQQEIVRNLEAHIDAGDMTAASVLVGKGDEDLFEWVGGRVSWSPGSRAVKPDDVFLIASITKPMVTSAVATLVAEGKLGLRDRISDYVPEFAGGGKEVITLEHCFTHTSGLTDMVPGDVELRKRNASLSDYVKAACGSQLLFTPGSDVRYQSSGILMLAAVAEKVSGKSLRELVTERVFKPAGMSSTDLCWRPAYEGRRVDARVVHGAGSENWNHNSPYWKNLGAPWGGAHSTAADIARLLRTVLDGGVAPGGRRVFTAHCNRMLVTDRIPSMPGLSDAARQAHGWGLGWVIRKSGGAWSYNSPAGAFGHSGATGTVAWADPRTRVIFVLLTNIADGPDVRGKCGEIVARALCARYITIPPSIT